MNDSENVEVPEEITKIFRQLFPAYTGPVRADLTASDVSGWDSMSHAELIMTVEDAYDVQINVNIAFEFETLGDLIIEVKKLESL